LKNEQQTLSTDRSGQQINIPCKRLARFLYAIAVPDATHHCIHPAKPVNFKIPTCHPHLGTEMVFSGTILVCTYGVSPQFGVFFVCNQTTNQIPIAAP
jgi:hypothetical protein